jgi:predicted NAD-dependent protein-ADP-ribosyltransferase YbiA (DUF1768 family)
VDGVSYNCNEQFYQRKKSRVLQGHKSCKRKMESMNPSEQNRIQVSGFQENKWEKVENEYMEIGLRVKFKTQN